MASLGNASSIVTSATGLKSESTLINISAATAPTTGQVLTATGASAATWQTPAGGGGGSGDFLANGTIPMTGSLTLGGATTGIIFEGTTADPYETTLLAGEPTADITLTLPVLVSDTLVGAASVQTLSNKTFVAPALGTPASGTLTNCTGLTAVGLVTSTTQAVGFGSVELGHASDTTLARVSAGVMSVEGNTVAMLAATETFTAPQRGTITTDNDLSMDLSVTNFWACTPSAGGALTFTNIPTGQGGTIYFVNGSNYAITAAATTKVTSTFLATISVTGTYIISYWSNGTNVYCSTAGVMA